MSRDEKKKNLTEIKPEILAEALLEITDGGERAMNIVSRRFHPPTRTTRG